MISMAQSELQFKEIFKKFLVREGFTILGDISSSSGDLLIGKDGRVTMIELKVNTSGCLDLPHALGQLLVARTKWGFHDS